MYLRSMSEVTMDIIGSGFDVDYYEYNSILTGYTLNKQLWEKKFKLIVNKDNSLRFKIGILSLEALCEPY